MYVFGHLLGKRSKHTNHSAQTKPEPFVLMKPPDKTGCVLLTAAMEMNLLSLNACLYLGIRSVVLKLVILELQRPVERNKHIKDCCQAPGTPPEMCYYKHTRLTTLLCKKSNSYMKASLFLISAAAHQHTQCICSPLHTFSRLFRTFCVPCRD